MKRAPTFHQQLIEKLRALITSGKIKPGEKFMAEREIAEHFHTSRPTANKALSSLVSEGLLEVRRGAGTFVRESLLEYDLERLVSFTDKARAAGKRPGTVLLTFSKLPFTEIPKEIAQRLQLKASDEAFYMERTRLADAKPVIYEQRYVSARVCRSMSKTNAKGSLYEYWTQKCKLSITGADEVIHAVNANKAQAQHLGVATGAACFQIIATGYIKGEEPLWYEQTLYRADAYEFRNRIGGISGTRAALGQITE